MRCPNIGCLHNRMIKHESNNVHEDEWLINPVSKFTIPTETKGRDIQHISLNLEKILPGILYLCVMSTPNPRLLRAQIRHLTKFLGIERRFTCIVAL